MPHHKYFLDIGPGEKFYGWHIESFLTKSLDHCMIRLVYD
jgi:hypothetical protein